MKLSTQELVLITDEYNDCFLEEINEMEKVKRACITGDIKIIKCKNLNVTRYMSGIFDLIERLKEYNNINTIWDEMYWDNNTQSHYICVELEWYK